MHSTSTKPTNHALFLVSTLILTLSLTAQPAHATPKQGEQTDAADMKQFCEEFSHKLRTVTYYGCMHLKLHTSKIRSVQNRPLTYREIIPNNNQPPLGKVLFIGGIHGDEFTAISLSYLWLRALVDNPLQNHFKWLFLPLVNPDGLLQPRGQRQNASGVDLNRNFPSPDWDRSALKVWKTHYHSNKRRYPGPYASSEPENKWLVQLIERYQPDAIISLHAPYGLLDYDGPQHAMPNKIGKLKLRALGTYPGSLGRYAGEYLNIPVLTIELNHAGRMPNKKEVLTMWSDVQKWLLEKVKTPEEE